MSIQFRPLNIVHKIMNTIGYEPGYAYDDLVFSNDAVFIIQFDKESEKKQKLFINKDCVASEFDRIRTEYIKKSLMENINVSYSGTFMLNSIDKTKEIEIAFSN